MKKFKVIFKDGSDVTIETTDYASTIYNEALREAVWQCGETVIPMSNIKAVIRLS